MEFIKNYLNIHDKEDAPKGEVAVKKRNYVGQGAFGKVLEATSPPNGAPNSPVLARFALKCIHPILRPSRLASELRLLRDLGGQANVVKMHTAHFHMGQVYILMDMIDHESFSDYVEKLDLSEIVDYMKNLFIALEHVHANNVIHRDIKPSNFLYNRKERTFSLVDFGLAHPMQDNPAVRMLRYKYAQHLQPTPLQHLPMTPPTTPKQTNHHFRSSHSVATNNHILSNSRHLSRYFVTSPTSRGWSHSFTNKRQSSTQESPPEIDQTFKRLRVNEDIQSTQTKYKQMTPMTPTSRRTTNTSTQGPSCDCRGLPRICSLCLKKPDPVAPKAGTPGYKAPEVLLRWRFQTTALDIWSAGVIFLCLLSGHYPLFRDVDDSLALAEITTLLGSEQVINAAKSIGFKLIVKPKRDPSNLLNLCTKIRQSNPKKTQFDIPETAHDLLKKLLDPNPLTRITATEALKHPFFEYK